MKIKEITKVKNKYLLKIDNEELLVHDDVIIKFRILSAKDIDDSLYKEIKEYAKITEGYYLAKKYLNKPRSTSEVKKYLIDNDLYHEQVIDILLEQHYLDDYKYAEIYMNYQKKYNLKGPKLIKKELQEKDISEEIISKLEYGDTKENQEKIVTKIKKKIKNKSAKELNNHIKKYLFDKGYSSIDIDFDIEIDEKPLIEKKILKLYDQYQKKYAPYEVQQKILANLTQKGYKYELIKECLKKIER